MGILKDVKDDSKGYVLSSRVTHFLSPQVWSRLSNVRKQRADRGWSDEDAWGAGDHIARITADMLQYLIDQGNTDWKSWFKHNIPRSEPYKDLESVIADIRGYLDHQKTSWTDEFNTSVDDHKDWTDDSSVKWINKKTGKKASKSQITAAIVRHHKKEDRLYKKATKAMEFFGRNFSSFWD